MADGERATSVATHVVVAVLAGAIAGAAAGGGFAYFWLGQMRSQMQISDEAAQAWRTVQALEALRRHAPGEATPTTELLEQSLDQHLLRLATFSRAATDKRVKEVLRAGLDYRDRFSAAVTNPEIRRLVRDAVGEAPDR